MKKCLKIILVIVILCIVFFLVDYKRVKNNKKPFFCIPIGTAMDGGTVEYWGAGYKVIDFHTISGYDDIKIGPWSMQYNDFENEIEKYNKIRDEKIEKIQSRKISTIEIGNSNIAYNLDIDEMYQILTMIEKLQFTSSTCNEDNKVTYYIRYNIVGENQYITYGVEAGIFGYHIISSDGTEAELAIDNMSELSRIMGKYFY